MMSRKSVYISSILLRGKHFQMEKVSEVRFRSSGVPVASDSILDAHSYIYDANGNLTNENVARNRLDNSTTNNISRRKLLWDGLNRLRGISEDGYVSLYWYDADGNRTVKEHLGGEAVWVNGTKAGVKTDSMEYSIYPSPYLSITGNRWTKHYYIGSEHIASRTGTLGDFSALHTSDNQSAGNGQVASVNYAAIRVAEEDSIASYYAQLGVPYEVQRNTRGSGVHLYLPTSLPDDNRSTSTASEYASSERDRDSLRNTPATLDGGQVYYYHRDPLGSTLSVSDSVGTLVQQVEYTPWGEVFVELRGDSTFTTPYLFNGKELDEETGLYYYGARYYDPKLSVWYSVDPLSNYNPLSNENHLDGEHNGGVFNPSNLNPYIYCYNSPIKYLDPNGEQVVAVHGTWSNNKTWKDRNGISSYASRRFGNKHFNFDFRWSGGNFTSYRHEAADKLIEKIRILRHKIDDQSEPITLVGHSHGGNVCIEAINKMLNMKEFDNIKINLLTINTPVRQIIN